MCVCAYVWPRVVSNWNLMADLGLYFSWVFARRFIYRNVWCNRKVFNVCRALAVVGGS